MLKIHLTKTLFVISVLFILPSQLYSQKNPIKFSKIPARYLEMKVYEKDTVADAIILTDYGISEIKYISGKGYVLEFTKHTRIKILKKEGLDYANIDIPLHVSNKNSQENLIYLKAQTYNLENGNTSISKLSKDDIYEEDELKYYKATKFAFPNVKIGSVIEYKYTIQSEFFYIKPWYFQSSIPVIYSEYRTIIPEFFSFRYFLTKYKAPTINKTTGSATVSDGARYIIFTQRWVFKHLPAFRDEDFITTPKDYLVKVEYEHHSTLYNGTRTETYTKTWAEICHDLMLSPYFGKSLNRHTIVKELTTLINPNTTEQEKINQAYKLVKQKMKWNGYNSIYIESTISAAYNKGEGNVAEINLLLVNLLRSVGIESYPLLLSTRSHGIINRQYPKKSGFNYVVAVAKIGDRNILLDASQDFLVPGNLPFKCINDEGLIVYKNSYKWIPLRSNEIFQKNISVSINYDNDGIQAEVLRQTLGLSARNLRHEIAQTGNKTFINNYIENQEDWIVEEYKIENVYEVTKPLVEKIKISEFTNIDVNSNLIYMPAIIIEESITNPFKEEERKYPVDFAIPKSTSYMLNLRLPEGFTLEELPENTLVTIPNNAAKFIYNAKEVNGLVQVYCQIRINKTIFSPDEYEGLKVFYLHITEKLNEQIVLKKTQQ